MTYSIPPDLMQLLRWRAPNLRGSGDTVCHGCRGPNPVWRVNHEMWIDVMEDDGGILCPRCFILVAEYRGIASDTTVWSLTAE